MFDVVRTPRLWRCTMRLLCVAAAALTGFVATGALAQSRQVPTLASNFAGLPLRFEPNRGQTDERVQFVARTSHATVYLTGTDVTLQTANLRRDDKGAAKVSAASAIRMHLADAGQSTGMARQPQAGITNYMRGADRSAWHTALPGYGAVEFANVYPGIGLSYHGRSGQLEYDFIVAPNADASTIRLQFDGTVARLDREGDLLLPTGIGRDLRFDKPVAYQTIDGKRVSVSASFAMNGRDVTFKLGSYDHTRELTIDPTLVYLGTIGSGIHQIDLGQVTVDSTGAMYFIGTTDDLGYPVTSGSYQTVCGPTANRGGQVTYYGGYCPASGGGETSAFVTKLSADGTSLVYSTYLSGKSGLETGNAIAVDGSGVAYLFGRTGSDDFPVTADAFQKTCTAYYGFNGIHKTLVPCDGNYNGGGTEYTILNTIAYFSKLSADGSSLTYSSFLGGTLPVYPNTVALDSAGSIYLSGQVTALSPDTLAPCAGSYTPDCLPNIQFPGITSSGYQTISNAHDLYGAYKDINAAAFLSKFSNDGHTLQYGTFFSDTTSGIDVNPTTMAPGANGVVFLGGYTGATNYPTTSGAIKKDCTMANSGYNGIYCNTTDGYVAAIDTTKSGAASLVYSTRIGGSSITQGNNYPMQQVLGLTADSSNNAYVTGFTTDSTFNMAAKGYQTACPNNTGNISPTSANYIDRCNSAFVLKINPTGTSIAAGSFLGGVNLRSAGSTGYNVRLDSKGQVYLYGLSNDGGGDFPQVNALQGYKGGNQLFVSAFSKDLTQLLFSTRFGNPSYTDHSVAVAGGLAIGADDSLYFAGVTTDTMFAGTAGTYNTATTTGQGRHPFFVKLSKVLQPDTTVLSITPATVATGSTVMYKAVVTGALQSTPIATGTVTFTATNTTPATVLGKATLDGSGTATLTAAAPAAGTYTVVASYGADSVYDVSTSSAVTLTVNTAVATTTTLTATPSAAKVGGTVTLGATVAGAGGTPSGTVTFSDSSTALGTVALTNGVATYTTTTLGLGSHTLTAAYSGDTTYGKSTSAVQAVSVTAYTVNASLAASPAVSPVGGTVTLTATLSGATGTMAPTGKVTFYNGTAVLGSVAVANNAATLATTMLPAGTNSLTAAYSGDANYATASSSAQTVTVRAPAATTTTLSSSAASASVGQPITFTAIVSSAVTTGNASGTVTFYDGTTSLGTGTLVNAQATLTTSALAAGSHSITAVYGGDALFLTSTSSAFTQAVVTPSITLTASPTALTITRGASGIITVTATPVGAYSGTLNFACANLPSHAACLFSPVTLTFAQSSAVQTSTLTFTTRDGATAQLRLPERNGRYQVLAAVLFLPLGLLGLSAKRRRFCIGKAGYWLLLLVSAGVVTLAGCGSAPNTTSAGAYAVQVTATVNGAATQLPVTVTVQ